MTKIRITYGLSVLITIILFIWSGDYYSFGIILLELALFFGLKLSLHLETAHLKLSLKIPSACVCGQKLHLKLSGSSFFAIASAVLEGDLVCEDQLLGNVTREPFSMNLIKNRIDMSLDFHPVCCGTYLIRLENVRCLDIFGLNSVTLSDPVTCRITVYPKPVSVHLGSQASPYGQMEEGQSAVNRHGHDASEVFDLREYQPGDDIHAIHWKLSQKMNELLVKEPADSPRYDTLVLLDIGQREHFTSFDPEQLSLTVSLALSVSKELLDRHIPHHVGTVAGGRLLIRDIRDQADFQHLEDLWMGLEIPHQKGFGIQLFSMEQTETHYRRLFYLTAGPCPEEIDSVRPDLDTTILCLHENAEESGVIRHGDQLFMNITMDQLKQGRLNISL